MPIATLTIDLVAKLANLEAGMARATSIAQRNAAQIEAAFSKARGIIAGLAAGVSIGGFVQFTKSTIEGLDALNDMADATGASIENLSAIEDVALRTGTSVEAVTGSLVKLNKALLDTKADPQVEQVLRKLGLSTKELQALDPAEALLKIAVAFKGFADDGDKARAAYVLFGKSLAEVAPLLKDLGEKGELVATVTTKQAQQAEEFANAVRSLNKDLTDLGRGFAGELIPFLKDMVDAMSASTSTTRGFGLAVQAVVVPLQTLLVLGSDVVFVFDRIGTQIGQFFAQVAAIARGDFEGVRAIRQAFAEESEQARKDLDAFQSAVMGQRRAENELQRKLEDRGFVPKLPGKKKLGTITDPGDKAKKVEPFVQPVPQSLADALKRLQESDPQKVAELKLQLVELIDIRRSSGGGTVDEAILAIEEALAELDPVAQQAKKARVEIEALLANTPSAKLQEGLQLAVRLRAELADTTDPKRIEQINDALFQLYETLDLLPSITSQAKDEMTIFAEQAARNIQDALGDTLYQSLSGKFDSIADLWKQLILRMIAEAAAAKLAKWLFGPVGANGERSGGVLEKVFEGIGNLFAGKFAQGGTIPAGQWGIVGEKGMEIARGPATITPLQAMGGGRSITWAPTINVSGDVGPGTVSLVERMLARERSRMMRAMA